MSAVGTVKVGVKESVSFKPIFRDAAPLSIINVDLFDVILRSKVARIDYN